MKHIIRVPIVGYELLVVEADSAELALAIVKQYGFLNERYDSRTSDYTSLEMIGHQYQKAELAGSDDLETAKEAGLFE